MKPFTILGIAGSIRKDSYNRATLRAVTGLAPEGVRVETFERLAEVPPFSEDQEDDPPPAVVQLKARVRAADAILFVTPEYNDSVPGVLKNAIDWASRPYGDNAWDGKPVAVMGASAGTPGTARAHYHLRQSFVFLNMHQLDLPEVMIAAAADRFDENGELSDQTSKELMRKQLAELVSWSRNFHASESAEEPAAERPADYGSRRALQPSRAHRLLTIRAAR